MLYLGIVIGLLIGAAGMHFRNIKDLSVLKATLKEAQDRSKKYKSQLYKRRSTYKKKSNAHSNGKKAKTKKAKTTYNVKKTNF